MFFQAQLLEEEALAGVPTLVYANKQDLLNAMSVPVACPLATELCGWQSVLCASSRPYSIRYALPPPRLSSSAFQPMQAAELMQALELVDIKDRWIHVEVCASLGAVLLRGVAAATAVALLSPVLRFLVAKAPRTPHAEPRQACSAKTGDGLEAGMQKLMAQKAKTGC